MLSEVLRFEVAPFFFFLVIYKTPGYKLFLLATTCHDFAGSFYSLTPASSQCLKVAEKMCICVLTIR